MPTITTHRHRWVSGLCSKCGLTRGRASRIDGDLATIERFLGSKEAQEALSKLDPVAFAITISGLRDAARKRHNAVIDAAMADHMKASLDALAKMASKLVSKTKLTITPRKTSSGTIKVDVSIADPTETIAYPAGMGPVTIEEV